MITGYSNIISVTTQAIFEFTVLTTRLTTGSSNADQFKLPLTTSTGLDIFVDWGDGTTNTITNHLDSAVTHTYASSGTYDIKITGNLVGWRFNAGGDRRKMNNISNWGVLRFTDNGMFWGCEDMTVTAADAAKIVTTDLSNTFRNCFKVTGVNFYNWDVSNVTNLSWFAGNAQAFIGDISSWNVSKVTNFSAMFFLNLNFNTDISGWDVSNATNMSQMFQAAPKFNRDISGWDVSKVTNFTSMFQGSTIFNQDIGGWNMSAALNVSSMFQSANAFDQDISSWDINQIGNFTNFMVSATGLSTANYDALLVGWEAQAPLTGKSINFGGSKYTLGSAAATARASLISNYGWTITDGGGVFDSDYQSVLNYATTQGYTLPSAGQQVKQNQLMLDLKTAGVWSKLDTFAVFRTDGNSDFALIDWVRLLDYTAVNSPTFTTNEGFQGNGTSSYIDTNFDVLNDSVNFEQNNASMGAYGDFVNAAVAGLRISFNVSQTQLLANAGIQFNGDRAVIANNALGVKLLQHNRSSSTAVSQYIDGVLTDTATSTSDPLAALNVYIGATNSNGTPTFFNTSKCGLHYMGANLESQAAALNTAWNNYIL